MHTKIHALKKAFLLLFAATLFKGCSSPEKPAISLEQALNEVTVETYKEYLSYLSSDDLKGRYPGKAGYDTAAAYVERLVRKMGLQPGGANGTYRQPIRFSEARLTPEKISATVNGQTLEHGRDFLMPAVHQDVSFSGDVVFVGTGIHAPELGYSDLEKVDVEGKVVMFLWRTTPDSFGAIERAVHGNLLNKRLRERGAIGFISVIPREAMTSLPWPLLTWLVARPSMRYISEEDEPYRSGILVSYETAADWVAQDGKNLADMMKMIKAGESPSYETSITAEVKASSRREVITSDNVAALVEGSDPDLKEEYLVLTAHLDHDGISSPVEGDSIYNGTIDNASGSAALLTLADKFGRLNPRRSMMFLWVTAEERGLLGSEYFAKYPTIDASKIVANQNMDAIVNLIAGSSDVLAYGYEHSNLSQSVDYALDYLGLDRSEDPRPQETFFVRSDQYSFVAEGIPAIWITGGNNSLEEGVDAAKVVDTWLTTRYHRPNDDLDQPLNYEAAMTELKCQLLIAHHIANELDQVKWNTDGFLYKTFVQKTD